MTRVTFRLPTPLRPLAGDRAELAVDGATVEEAAVRLAEDHPRLRARLLTTEGHLRPSVAIYRNDQDVRTLDGG
ncbi:thiamine S protein, partial [mine drainage metagenome]